MNDHQSSTTDELPDGGEDNIPEGGKIVRTPTAQTVMAVSFLILVTLISFLAVGVIGELIVPNDVTYWMIELIFALLCGGAGALVGGSAAVRSSLGIPGSPIHATLGGAVSMIIVGFAVASLGRPSLEQQMYALEIHDIPLTENVDGVDYKVYTGPVDNAGLVIGRDPNTATIKIPVTVTTYKAVIAVYMAEKDHLDHSRTFARCMLTFDTFDAHSSSLAPMELIPERDLHFRLISHTTTLIRSSKPQFAPIRPFKMNPVSKELSQPKKRIGRL